ncbi:hypothetical protein ACJ72_00730 [Emergomyces africanus]|uniref:Uncharacterized protein n=1 Tax=Emergomyces africanus TaxID=1955775 RepID=A0A1B7P7E4_9EURO|nr:hypothetical protein ACJ72_00730 [Emergomyces africanus]
MSLEAQGQPGWYLLVFKPEYDTVAFDPLDPVKRYHEGLFVETDPVSQDGTLFHVTGDIIAAGGMMYEERTDSIPGASKYLFRNPQIGRVLKTDFHSGRIITILRDLPTPSKQQGINCWEPNPNTGHHDITWTKQNGDFYKSGEEQRPIFKCNEWTHQLAIPALRNAGVLCHLA